MACLAIMSVHLSIAQAARVYGVSAKIMSRWTAQYRTEGREGVQDRSSRPKLIPTQTAAGLAERIITHRRQRLCGRHIAELTGVSPATVSRVLKRAGLSRMRDLLPPEPVVRYTYKEPGGLIHLDIKKLARFERVGHRISGDRTGQSNARGVGWEFVHVCIDDASRIAVTGIYPDEKAVSAIAALRTAVAFYQDIGITVTRVMPPLGDCRQSPAGQPAERFIQTALREWTYARADETSDRRKSHLPEWTHMYNWHRPHGSLCSKPPISRLDLTRDNLLRFHT